MATLLGGQLTLKSTVGKGSVFQIQIPLVFEQALFEKNKSATVLKKRYTALVLDDDSNLLQLITEVLKQNDYLVFSFSTAAEALSWIEKNSFDIVITDIQMPLLDGFLFLEKLQKGSYINFKKQPVVAVTGRSDLNLEQYKAAGFTTVIRKPYTPKSLINTLESILNKESVFYQFEDKPITPEIHSAKGYSLTELNLFLSQDKQAIKDILSEFINQTNKNLSVLQHAIKEHDFVTLKNTAHRMNPMFKQINAFEVNTLLNQLEQQENSISQLNTVFPVLKNKIVALFLSIFIV